MNRQMLVDTAQALIGRGKGLLAMDESNQTCDKRFADLGIAQTGENRRAYREMIVTTPGLGKFISGAILYDETIGQSDCNGTLFVRHLVNAGIMPGIKVDLGEKTLALHAGENITEGLDGLQDRLKDYAEQGAQFAKWRAAIGIYNARPSRGCIEANAHALARYAALCQAAGIVPIVEPEIMMDGDHSLERCQDVTEHMLRAVFEELHTQKVMLEGLILKPNMVLPGLSCPKQHAVSDVTHATVQCLLRNVPASVAGVAFLSGGQSAELASARLNAMNVMSIASTIRPWPLVFSFARAIQQPALKIWNGQQCNVKAAQDALLHRAQCNHAALRGHYSPVVEDRQIHQQALRNPGDRQPYQGAISRWDNEGGADPCEAAAQVQAV